MGDNCAVPDHCFKVVKSLSTGKILFVIYFTNEVKDAKGDEITIDELLNKIGYQIPLSY
jgi:hypothetical protein